MTRHRLSEEINAALAAAIGRPERVLDLGCGAGVNGMVARMSGARVTGVENDAELAARAERLLDEVVRVDPEDRAALERALGERRFDLILVPDALEYARDPAALVKSAATFLDQEGRIVASVRNERAWPLRLSLGAPEIGYSDDGARMFTRSDASQLFSGAGLEVLSLDENPMLLKALRRFMSEDFYLSLKHGEEWGTGFRDLSAYQMYLNAVRPFELLLTRLSPDLFSYQHVIVARRKPAAKPLSLTIGMLTMDEEPSAARMIDEIKKYAPDAKILCIDSSMKDQTPIIAEKMGARVIRQLPPRGHGPAMELLMYEAAKQSEALIYLDCDFTYPPSDIPKIRRILESGVDVVNAARIRTKPEAMPIPNYLANKTFVVCAQVLNGMKVADLHSGMRGYRASVIRAFAFDGEGDALPIDTLLWPARCGYHVVEIPIDYQERVGFSKLRKLAGTVWTFIRLGKTLRVGKRRKGTYDVWDNADG